MTAQRLLNISITNELLLGRNRNVIYTMCLEHFVKSIWLHCYMIYDSQSHNNVAIQQHSLLHSLASEKLDPSGFSQVG